MVRTIKRLPRPGLGWAFAGAHLLGVAGLSLAPMVRVLISSFRTPTGSRWVGLENYRVVLENTAFRLAVGNTVRFVAVCIPLLLGLSLAVAVVLWRLPRVGRVLRRAFLLPMAVPAASVVLVWKVLFHKQGLLNAAGALVGLPAVDYMGSDAAFWMLVVSYLWKNLGYTVVLWLAGLSAIAPEIQEAAQVDGASGFQVFRFVIVPNLGPTAYILTVLSLLNSFKVFREAWLVAGDYPHESMYLLQHLYNNWFRELDYHKISAAGVLTAGVIFGLIRLLRRAWEVDG